MRGGGGGQLALCTCGRAAIYVGTTLCGFPQPLFNLTLTKGCQSKQSKESLFTVSFLVCLEKCY